MGVALSLPTQVCFSELECGSLTSFEDRGRTEDFVEEPGIFAHDAPTERREPLTTVLEDVLFELPDYPTKKIVFDAESVRDRLSKIVDDEDLRRPILVTDDV